MTFLRPSGVDTSRLLPVLLVVAAVLLAGSVMPWAAAVAAGGAAGAAAALVWRRARAVPFDGDPGEKLGLR